jgi:hypothetical protein
LKGMEAISLSFWVFVVKRGPGWLNILKKGASEQVNTPTISLFEEDGSLEIQVSTGTTTSNAIISNGAIPIGRWSHIGLSISTNMVALYINGFLDFEREFSERIIVRTGSD